MASEVKTPLLVELNPPQLEVVDRFQLENGLASREEAVALLMHIAIETVTSTGRRIWDRPVVGLERTETDEPLQRAQALAERLRAEGHHAAAEHVHHATVGSRIGGALLAAVREACQTVLTTIEALDPKTELMAEELRLEIDKRLSR